MSNVIPTANWKQLTASPYGGYYLVEDRILATVPHPGAQQTAEIALQQLQRLRNIIADQGRPCGNIVFVDRVSQQSAAARRIWSQQVGPDLLYGCALVCSSVLARAIGSFFIGIRGTRVPTRMFANLDTALQWLREQRDSERLAA